MIPITLDILVTTLELNLVRMVLIILSRNVPKLLSITSDSLFQRFRDVIVTLGFKTNRENEWIFEEFKKWIELTYTIVYLRAERWLRENKIIRV